jgi:hypothetical protein
VGQWVIFAAGEAGYAGKVIHVAAGHALSLQDTRAEREQGRNALPGPAHGARHHHELAPQAPRPRRRGHDAGDGRRPEGTLTQSGSNIATGNTAWQQYTGTYSVPAGQTTTRFAFQAVTAGSYGNFIDDIVFTPENCQ